MTLFTIRWLLPANFQHERYPAIAAIGSSLPIVESFIYTLAFYLLWQLLYYVFIVYGCREKIAHGLRLTSYTWLLSDKTSFVSRLIGKVIKDESGKETNQLKIFAYYTLQFGYMFISVLPVCCLYYSYMQAYIIVKFHTIN